MTNKKDTKEDEEEKLPQPQPQSSLSDPKKSLEFAQKAAESLQNIVEKGNASVQIRDKTYLKFEGWQTLARFFGYTVGSEAQKVQEDGIDGWEAVATVYDDKGTKIGHAEAICSRDEENWEESDEYAIKSMAQTRASAKALRNILSWVAVLAEYSGTPAEEMQKGGYGGSNDPASRKQIDYIKTLIAKSPWSQEAIVNKKGKLDELTKKEASDLIEDLKEHKDNSPSEEKEEEDIETVDANSIPIEE